MTEQITVTQADHDAVADFREGPCTDAMLAICFAHHRIAAEKRTANLGAELPDTHNPDAAAWAKSFCDHFPDADEGLMIGWFANAMMAMHDHLMQKHEWTEKRTANRDVVGALKDDDVYEMLVRAAASHAKNKGSTGVKAWCLANNVNPAHASEFINRRRAPCTDLLDALGLTRCYSHATALASLDTGKDKGLVDYDELEDEIEAAIADSFDEEWTARDGARHAIGLLRHNFIIRTLEEEA